jgi:hypothetical protein
MVGGFPLSAGAGPCHNKLADTFHYRSQPRREKPTMPRWIPLGLTAAALLCAAPLAAQDKTGPAAPAGSWVREMDGVTVRFTFTGGHMKCAIEAGGVNIDVDADVAVSKDGVLFGRVTKVERKGLEVGPAAGDLFSFRYVMKGKTVTIDDLRGTGGAAEGRALVEGEYKLETAKKKGS